MAMIPGIPPGLTPGQLNRALKAESAKYGHEFERLPMDGKRGRPGSPVHAMRNRHFLVQVFQEPDFPQVLVRLSINRTTRAGDRWEDGITWDQLQRIKAAVGYGQHDALEVYPRDSDVVNVANIRHLWVMRDPVPFAWRKDA